MRQGKVRRRGDEYTILKCAPVDPEIEVLVTKTLALSFAMRLTFFRRLVEDFDNAALGQMTEVVTQRLYGLSQPETGSVGDLSSPEACSTPAP